VGGGGYPPKIDKCYPDLKGKTSGKRILQENLTSGMLSQEMSSFSLRGGRIKKVRTRKKMGGLRNVGPRRREGISGVTEFFGWTVRGKT